MTATITPLKKGASRTDVQPGEEQRYFNSMRPMKPTNIKEAIQLASGSAVKRSIGEAMIAEDNDHIGGRFEIAQANDMEAAAAEYLDIGNHVTGPQSIGNGGEMVVRTSEAQGSIPGVLDLLRQSPDMLSAGASRDRMELTGNAVTMAIDAAASIQAKNSLERMLAHEMAGAHRLAMLFAEQSASLLERARPQYSGGPISQQHSVEASRLANASARMMGAFQDGMLALDRIRRGGRQHVTVKHVVQQVTVKDGGQAVVSAGAVKGGGRKNRGTGRK